VNFFIYKNTNFFFAPNFNKAKELQDHCPAALFSIVSRRII